MLLHLIDAAGSQTCPTTLALLRQAAAVPGFAHQVLLLGSDRFERDARLAQLTAFTRVGVPFGHALYGFAAAATRIHRQRNITLIHCWSFSSLALATLLRPMTPKVLSLTMPPDARQIRWLLRLLSRVAGRRLVITVPHEPMSRWLEARGVPRDQIAIVPPAIDPAMLDHPASSSADPSTACDERQATYRRTMRQAWGIDDDHTAVVALLSDPPTAADVRSGIFVVGLACESLVSWSGNARHYEHRLLVHPQATNRRQAQDVMDNFGTGWRIVQEGQLAWPWRVLPACDVAMVTGESWAGLSIAWAQAARIPVIAEASDTTRHLIRHDHDGLLGEAGKPKRLAYQLQRLLADQHLVQRLTDAAWQRITDATCRQQYQRDLSNLYADLLNTGEPMQQAIPS